MPKPHPLDKIILEDDAWLYKQFSNPFAKGSGSSVYVSVPVTVRLVGRPVDLTPKQFPAYCHLEIISVAIPHEEEQSWHVGSVGWKPPISWMPPCISRTIAYADPMIYQDWSKSMWAKLPAYHRRVLQYQVSEKRDRDGHVIYRLIQDDDLNVPALGGGQIKWLSTPGPVVGKSAFEKMKQKLFDSDLYWNTPKASDGF